MVNRKIKNKFLFLDEVKKKLGLAKRGNINLKEVEGFISNSYDELVKAATVADGRMLGADDSEKTDVLKSLENIENLAKDLKILISI